MTTTYATPDLIAHRALRQTVGDVDYAIDVLGAFINARACGGEYDGGDDVAARGVLRVVRESAYTADAIRDALIDLADSAAVAR